MCSDLCFFGRQIRSAEEKGHHQRPTPARRGGGLRFSKSPSEATTALGGPGPGRASDQSLISFSATGKASKAAWSFFFSLSPGPEVFVRRPKQPASSPGPEARAELVPLQLNRELRELLQLSQTLHQ